MLKSLKKDCLHSFEIINLLFLVELHKVYSKINVYAKTISALLGIEALSIINSNLNIGNNHKKKIRRLKLLMSSITTKKLINKNIIDYEN